MSESKGKPASGGKGIASGLQPGGTAPGAQPGASQGSIGTGGASTGGEDTGNVARRERNFPEGDDKPKS